MQKLYTLASVANMSIIGNVAIRCVHLNYISVLINCVKVINDDDEDGAKHLIAALHNLSDVKKFPEYLCDCKGVEVLRETQSYYPEGEILAFIDGIFESAELPTDAMTSLQVSAACCGLTTALLLLKRGINIEEVDLQGNTALDIALKSKNGEIAQLLIASGAEFDQSTFEHESSIETMHKKEMLRYIKKGKNIRIRSIDTMHKVLYKSQPKLCKDVCTLVTSCVPGIDLLLVLQ